MPAGWGRPGMWPVAGLSEGRAARPAPGRRLLAPSARRSWRRRGYDVVEADRPSRPAELDKKEMPGRLWHRAPLLGLGADIEAAGAPARTRPAPDRSVGNARDERVDNDAHSGPDSELIAKDHTALLTEGERPRYAADAERNVCLVWNADSGWPGSGRLTAPTGAASTAWPTPRCGAIWPCAGLDPQAAIAPARTSGARTVPTGRLDATTRAAARRASMALLCIDTPLSWLGAKVSPLVAGPLLLRRPGTSDGCRTASGV